MVQRIPAPGELEPIERASRDELQALQLERLKWSLQHAYDNVPHYRAAFDAAGVHPDDLKTLADLAKFPFTDKKTLRDNYPFGLFAVPREQVVRIHASSGTTGKADRGRLHPERHRHLGRRGGALDPRRRRPRRRHGAHRLRLRPVHRRPGRALRRRAPGLHRDPDVGRADRKAGAADLRLQAVESSWSRRRTCSTSSRNSRARAWTRPTSSLKVGIFGAEPWTDAMRAEIEARAGIDAVDIYGLSEVMGPGVASECIESKDGPVIWEDHFYPEIIDPETGEVLPDGEEGELVFTSLTKEALPIIRYRTRDLTRLLPPTSRSMRRMGKITGRSDDMLIIRGVNVFPSQIEELILKMPALAPHYQLVVVARRPPRQAGSARRTARRVACRRKR